MITGKEENVKQAKVAATYAVDLQDIRIDYDDQKRIIADIVNDHINGLLRHQIFSNDDFYVFWSGKDPGLIDIGIGIGLVKHNGEQYHDTLIEMSFDIDDIWGLDQPEEFEMAIKTAERLEAAAQRLRDHHKDLSPGAK